MSEFEHSTICTPIEFVQAEGHSTVRVFNEPKAGLAPAHQIASHSQGLLLERHQDPGGCFCKVSAEAGNVIGWVGAKNVKISPHPCSLPGMSEDVSPSCSSLETKGSPSCRTSLASTDVPSRRGSISSLESVDATFDARSFVQYHGAGIEMRYLISMDMIASGGYGKVFTAEDKRCKGRVVAIKKVLGLGESTAAKFMTEAKIMQDLDHPGICKLFEVYQDGDVLYFVLEYLEGGDLFDKISSGSEKMSEETVADIIKQVACALKYAHSRGVAHRDLKPENICFCNSETNQVKVIDWGLSSDFHRGSMKSSVGSPTYCGPEVHDSHNEVVYTSACDLWSLGVLTYVLLCGKPPFWGSPSQLSKKMNNEDYPMHDAGWMQTSEGAKDFIRRLLKAKPQQRMTIDEALSHDFLMGVPDQKVERPLMHSVLSNMVSFSSFPRFFSLLVTSAARQSEHSNVNTIRKVFNELDVNHDGVLELPEVQAAFEETYGQDSDEVRQIQHIFNKLDLDGRGRLTYTEFCAAAMGEDERVQGQMLCLAFHAFDSQVGGRISEDEIGQLLARAGAHESLSKVVCEAAAREVMEAYDHDSDGALNFEEFAGMMHSFAKPDAVHLASRSELGDYAKAAESISTPEKRRHKGSNCGTRTGFSSWAEQLAQKLRNATMASQCVPL